MLSYWEQQHFTQYDYLVVGAGLVGITTALSLRELHPDARIGVLERGIFPSGASTKNAGFACFGSVTELLTDIIEIGEQATVDLVARRWEGLKLLRARVGDQHLDLKQQGGYELLSQEDLSALESIDRLNDLLEPIFGQEVYRDGTHKVKDFGLNPQKVAALIESPLEAQLDAGSMMKHLWALTRIADINLFTGTRVTNFQQSKSLVEVSVDNGMYPVSMTCRRLAVCTNAFSQILLPDVQLQPGRGIVLITRPIPGLRIKGVFHYQQGYYYFRNVGDRILLGGGRNLDFEGETTMEFGVTAAILDHLERLLKEMIIPGVPYEIEHRWSGIMGFGSQKTPLIGKVSPDVGYAVRLGGMGIALGSLLGDQLAKLLYINP